MKKVSTGARRPSNTASKRQEQFNAAVAMCKGDIKVSSEKAPPGSHGFALKSKGPMMRGAR